MLPLSEVELHQVSCIALSRPKQMHLVKAGTSQCDWGPKALQEQCPCACVLRVALLIACQAKLASEHVSASPAGQDQPS